MPDDGAASFSAGQPAPWLEVLSGNSSCLLIAPHGGRAGPAARAALHPKVNDLHTADITRELAVRLGASALINTAMDRNALDCNRWPQLLERAPWLLELIAAHVERILARHRRATVLLIHGWNIIEPRLDFGLGLRSTGDLLRPVGSAHVSASDEFINGPVQTLREHLRAAGVRASFGLRYPAGDSNNLLQLFTARHLTNGSAPVRTLGRFARNGEIDALQLELSVALRLPGRLRRKTVDAMASAFTDSARSPHTDQPWRIERVPRPRSVLRGPKARPRDLPTARVGLEFYDPAAQKGAMASFDLGVARGGARIMLLLGQGRVALFTGEGGVERSANRLSLGPLWLEFEDQRAVLGFSGPAAIVSDSTAYLSIERALASSTLDEELRISAELELGAPAQELARALAALEAADAASMPAAFGHLRGHLHSRAGDSQLNAVARVGLSFSALGPASFATRRMIWACFGANTAGSKLEARASVDRDGEAHQSARLAAAGQWSPCTLDRFELETPSFDAPPGRIEAALSLADGRQLRLHGQVESFVPLSRPGTVRTTRVYTSLGFASFTMGSESGAGMFEYSRCREAGAPAGEDEPVYL